MGMRKDFILKREDGTRINISASLSYYRGPEYNWEVLICQPKKRTFKPAVDTDSWKYRELSVKDRVDFVKMESLKFVTTEEVLKAKRELWNLLDPELFGF
jgi:hypothetical protein